MPMKYSRQNFRVALHPEGVDRNLAGNDFAALLHRVALHPEGVDRNKKS